MERYQVLTTTAEQPFVNKASEMLEDAGIPIMVEHVKIAEKSGVSNGFNILVPRQYQQSAKRLIDAASTLKSHWII
jgi:hypothetical protein